MNKLNLLELHPQFLSDEKGTKIAVQLPLKEYEELLQLFEGLKDIIDLEQARLHPVVGGVLDAESVDRALQFITALEMLDRGKVPVEQTFGILGPGPSGKEDIDSMRDREESR